MIRACIVAAARDLMSGENGTDNPEYARALLELSCDLLGVTKESSDGERLAADLGLAYDVIA